MFDETEYVKYIDRTETESIDTGLKCRIEQSGDANFNINTLEDAKAAENYLNTGKRGE